MAIPEIRFAQKEDIKELVNLCRQHATFERTTFNSTGLEQKLNTHLFAVEPPLSCLIAEVNQVVVGYATYMKQFSTWEAEYYLYMDCLFLSSQSRGLGIGPILIDRIKEEARKAGCNQIQWQTPNFNKRAIKFYKRIGAKAESKERFYLSID